MEASPGRDPQTSSRNPMASCSGRMLSLTDLLFRTSTCLGRASAKMRLDVDTRDVPTLRREAADHMEKFLEAPYRSTALRPSTASVGGDDHSPPPYRRGPTRRP